MPSQWSLIIKLPMPQSWKDTHSQLPLLDPRSATPAISRPRSTKPVGPSKLPPPKLPTVGSKPTATPKAIQQSSKSTGKSQLPPSMTTNVASKLPPNTMPQASKPAGNLQLPSPIAQRPNATSPSVPAGKIANHFSRSQLALALTISKSKPKGLSIEEYCQQLRNNIRAGKRILDNELRFVDTPEFWREQYTRIHTEKKALETKVAILEEAQRQLCAKHRLDDSSESDGDQSQSSDLDAQLRPASRKRPASREHEALFWQSNGLAQFSPADNMLFTLSSYVLRIKKLRSLLEQACKDLTTLDHIETLASRTLQLLALLTKVLPDCCLPLQTVQASLEDSRLVLLLQQVLDQVGLSFLSCFKALQELCRSTPGRAKKHEIVYKMIMFFNETMALLKAMSDHQVRAEAAANYRKPRPKRARTEAAEYATTKYLAKTLSSVLYSLDWKLHQPGHSEILEGILFFVLEHIGKLLSEATFGEHIANSDNPGNMTNFEEQPIKEISKFDARYMVQILHAALGGSSRKEIVAKVLTSGRTIENAEAPHLRSRGASILSGDLMSKARHLLQSTLMKTSLGESHLEALKMPTLPAEESNIQVETEEGMEDYGSDWLIQAVWALVGWDLVT